MYPYEAGVQASHGVSVFIWVEPGCIGMHWNFDPEAIWPYAAPIRMLMK
jgi:hypothetical protein